MRTCCLGLYIEKASFQGVVKVRGVVGDFVDAIDELASRGGRRSRRYSASSGKSCGAIIARMLHDAFANFKGQIEAGKIHIALLEMLDDAQGVEIVIEAAAMGAHQFV